MSNKISSKEFCAILRSLLADDDRPIVVYSAIWPLLGAFDYPNADLAQMIINCLIEVAGPKRTLCLPAFTSGYKNGFLDLDETPGISGVLAELFRKQPQVVRTTSAFFSFSCLGPQAKELQTLRPKDAWGEGSFYAWMEECDAQCLMLGTGKTTSSYVHRLEWLCRDVLPYRYEKDFFGQVKLAGQNFELKECLLVRDLKTEVDNSWLEYEPVLEDNGLKSVVLGRGYISALSTLGIKNALFPFIQRDPFAFVKDKERMRLLYHKKELQQ